MECGLRQPNFILLTETWLKPEIPDSIIAIQGYSLYRHDRQAQRGGGTCIYTKNQIAGYNTIVSPNRKHDIPVSMNPVILNIRIHDLTFTIGCIYRSQTTTEDDDHKLNDTINSMFETENLLFLFEDFNHPEIDWTTYTVNRPSRRAEEFLNSYKAWNAKQVINSNTRFRNDQSSQLDLVLVSDDKLISEISCNPPLGRSDHSVLSITAQLKLKNKPTHTLKSRNFWRADYSAINTFIAEQEQEEVGGTGVYDKCENLINQAIAKYIPEGARKLNPQKPWINHDLLKAIKKKKNN